MELWWLWWLLVLAKDVDHVFKSGIAIAPVTSWIYYQSVYTERYMDLPTPESNRQAYVDSDINLIAEGIRGHDYLLIHGTADDNVHYQHAMILSRVLQKAEIPFEQMSYPDEDHGLGGVQLHLFKTMDHFWERHFNL